MPITYWSRMGKSPIEEGLKARLWHWLIDTVDTYVHPNSSRENAQDVSLYGLDPTPPIHRIPAEILGEIFILCLQDCRPFHSRPCAHSLSPTSYADPEVLGQVCRTWRAVTLLTPSLWSTICVYKPKPQHISKVELWLKRSRSYPLCLKITETIAENHHATGRVLDLLFFEVHRWKIIEFSFRSSPHQLFLTLPYGATKALESASVNIGSWGRACADRFWQILHSSTSLRHVNWGCSFTEVPPHLPCAQLMSIQLWLPQLSADGVISLLAACPRIEEVVLQAFDLEDTSPAFHPPLLLSNLHRLSIGDLNADPEHLFNRLTLPTLTHLTFAQLFKCNLQSFRRLLDRSSCQLDVFRFRDHRISEDALLTYLQVPQLARLKELFLSVPITDRILTSLSQQPSGTLLPQLEVLDLYPSCCASDGLLSTMIRSRLPSSGPSSLRYVHVFLKEKTSPRDLRALESVVKHHDWVNVEVE